MTMDKSIIAALVIYPLTFVGGLITLALTHYLNRKRDREADLRKIQLDHEADWQKFKLESYNEYFNALSAAVSRPSDMAAQARYIDAGNKLALVASSRVLSIFYPYQDRSTLYRATSSPTQDQMNAIQSSGDSFFRAVREDCHPTSPSDGPDIHFKILLLPPKMAAGSDSPSPQPAPVQQ
jgi:hypothetical protein